jgi:hypothetical protein
LICSAVPVIGGPLAGFKEEQPARVMSVASNSAQLRQKFEAIRVVRMFYLLATTCCRDHDPRVAIHREPPVV